MTWYLPPALSRQVSSLVCKGLGSAQQMGQNMLKCGIHFAYNYLYMHFVIILYTNCIYSFYDVYTLSVDQNWRIQNAQNVCQNLFHILLWQFFWFCMQNVYKSLLKCGIHFVYISCMHLLGSSRAQWVTGAKLFTLRLMPFSPSYTGVAIKSCQRLLSKNNENLSCFVTVTL